MMDVFNKEYNAMLIQMKAHGIELTHELNALLIHFAELRVADKERIRMLENIMHANHFEINS